MNKSNLISIIGLYRLTVITFTCDLDTEIIAGQRCHINQSINEKNHNLIIDLCNVPFIDNHGIRLFASLLKKAYAKKKDSLFLLELAVNQSLYYAKSILRLVRFNDNISKRLHYDKRYCCRFINKISRIGVNLCTYY